MAKNTNRDEFTRPTRRMIERQARGHCSNPDCRRLTHSATSDADGEINIGEAAHICAAAPGGPRYDEKMTSEQRRSADNGIWLCDVHARAVDSKDSKFTVEELRAWKRRTNEDSWRSVMQNLPYGPGMHAPTPDALRNRLREAAIADLAVFRRTAKWPGTSVALTLKVGHVDEALSTRALANGVSTLDDLILVAAPGMGKTTTLFQVAESVLEIGNGTPLIVPLGDWATEGDALLASILKRPAFGRVSETDFRAVADKPGVVLLLDGWNELDAASRERARVQITSLKAELPEIGLVISTRRQALDIPFAGTRVDLLPLNDAQQMEIARALRGETGARLVDQAWRTAGVRDLVAIPLYLTVLLSLPDGAPFPTTKEEVLRRFVTAHEQEARHAAALQAVTSGFQQGYLDRLAVFATTTANTAITDTNARRMASETTRILVNDGQINISVQPDTLLDTLVSNHVLARSGDGMGYSFQHQQFQEWYASHDVERLMARAAADPAARGRLKAEVINQRQWGEAILFAVERSARGDAAMKDACGAAILSAFEVDPILAAEMIFRVPDDVWLPISAEICGLIGRWHTSGRVDRAVRFMVTSGRPEFGDVLWPLITAQNDQIQLATLRAARRFRPSALGNEASRRIAGLPREIRKNLLQEIALNSGVDGIDLATAIAKVDSDPEIRALVVDALSFRRADRHVADLLTDADDATYDILLANGHVDDIAIEAVQQRLVAARTRRKAVGMSRRERLQAFLRAPQVEEPAAEVADAIAEMDIDPKQDGERHLLYEIGRRYPQALADGLLRRVRGKRTLPYGADDILASAGLTIEDEALVDIALGETPAANHCAEAAASVLGPTAVGRMIDAYLAASRGLVRNTNAGLGRAAGDRYHDLHMRIAHTPGASLVAAVQARAATTDNEEILQLAGLLSRDTSGDGDRRRPFTQDGLATIRALAEEWGDRMLASGIATRRQTASIAILISHAPSPRLLPILKRLLDDNLRRYRASRQEAEASGWRQGPAVNEARMPHTGEYQHALIAIRAPETAWLLHDYLADEHFGALAAKVLANHWLESHEPKDDRQLRGGVDFSRVEARRAARASHPAETSPEAEAIFGVVDSLITDGTSEGQNRLAVDLGIVGARLPHGQRDATFGRLMVLAPRQARAALLQSLILSGEEIDIQLLASGLAETFEAGKTQPWILTQSDSYQLRDWLRLLPFANPVSEIPTIVRSLPDAQRDPHLLEEMIGGLGTSPSADAENVLFSLAENDPRFYANYQWLSTALRLGTVSVARRLVDLTVRGALSGRSMDNWHWGRELGNLISEFPDIRVYVYELLERNPQSQHIAILASAVGHDPGPEGLIMLVDYEIKTGRSFTSWKAIESVVTSHVPSEDWKGAYNIVPVPAIELRQKLLGLTTSGGADDPAARCLNLIDKLRDQYGAPETEPRHPDLASGKPWPILVHDPDAE
jgi:hypothetical protein